MAKVVKVIEHLESWQNDLLDILEVENYSYLAYKLAYLMDKFKDRKIEKKKDYYVVKTIFLSDDRIERVDAFDYIIVYCNITNANGVKGFIIGNIIKYIVRANRKEDIIKDLRKAHNYTLKMMEIFDNQ
jgi:hypothetical protein